MLSSLRTLPRAGDWGMLAVAMALFAAFGLTLGFATGFLTYNPVSLERAAWTALVVFFTPALTEELLFRSWLPRFAETRRPIAWIGGSTAAFVVYHFVLLLWMSGANDIFLRPEFLVSAAVLGVICAVLRMRSGSLWPAVIFHWTTDVLWLTQFGGPYLNRLLGS